MIEITSGTHEERIIKLLQNIYPITIEQISIKLKLSKKIIKRVLQKFQVKGIVKLEPLPNKTYVRLLRRDIGFVAKKRQRKFIKHSRNKRKEPDEYDGIMYS